jgi:hypothetical protein
MRLVTAQAIRLIDLSIAMARERCRPMSARLALVASRLQCAPRTEDSMMKMRAGYVALLAAGLLSPLGCGVGGAVDDNGTVTEELVVPSAVANMVPSGVVQSTGNLYWTRNVLSGGVGLPLRWNGRVYRAGKSNIPGQEAVIYSEAGVLGSSFGSITFANYNGVWYGYFLATYRFGGTVIKRVPLDGSGGAITVDDALMASPGSALQSDGAYLYFYGANALYAAPLAGGSTVTVSATAGINSFGFDRAHLYYSAGNQLFTTLKPNYGTFTRAIATFDEPVASVFVNPGADNDDAATSIAIGTTHSAILWTQSANHSPGLTTLATNPYFSINSVTATGTHVMWTWCSSTGSTSCYVANQNRATQGMNVYSGTQVQTGARSIMADGSQMFFVDNYAFERLAY